MGQGELSAAGRRLDEEKIETLRAWGEGLQTDPREEVRAAGRAITMLVEEIEHLNVDLWNARADRIEQGPFVADVTPRNLPPPLPSL